MTDSELYTLWGISLGIAAVIVIIAAALLIAIIMIARSICQHAREAEDAVAQIAASTSVIWALDETNALAREIQDEARRLDGQTERIADVLQGSSTESRG